MQIDKEILNKYIEAIKAVVDNDLFHLNNLSKLVETIILSIPKISEFLELNNSYDIDEKILIEAVKHVTGKFGEFEVVNVFSEYNNNLIIDYRVISWMRNYIETFLPVEEIQKMIKDKNHAKFIFNNSYDFGVMYDTNTETNEFDLIEFKDSHNREINLDSMDLTHFSSKSFGMFLELDKYALDIDTGKKFKFEDGVLQVLSNSKYVPVYEVMTAKEITELFSHRFEKGSAYEN